MKPSRLALASVCLLIAVLMGMGSCGGGITDGDFGSMATTGSVGGAGGKGPAGAGGAISISGGGSTQGALTISPQNAAFGRA